MDPIPQVHASLGKQELAAVEEVFRSEWQAGQGPKGKALEAELAERYEVAGAVALSSCGAALHLALLALGVQPGDEVIVADYTFPAPAHAVRYVGAHAHDRSQEFFYIVDGELDVFAFEPVKRTEEGWQDWESADGDRVVRAGAGSCMFVPAGCPHAFTNPTGEPARMLFQSYPAPDHERYFEELLEIFSAGPAVDPDAVQQLRDRYGLSQITPLRYGPTA